MSLSVIVNVLLWYSLALIKTVILGVVDTNSTIS